MDIEIFLLIFFILLCVLNFSKRKLIKIRTYRSLSSILFVVLIFLFFVFIIYRNGNDIISFAIALFVSLFFLSSIIYKGFGEDTLYTHSNYNMIIKGIRFKDIDKYTFIDKDGEDYFELKIEKNTNVYYDRFFNSDRKSIEKILNKSSKIV